MPGPDVLIIASVAYSRAQAWRWLARASSRASPVTGLAPARSPGIGSAPKRCSRQAEFHYILSRRSPVGRAREMSEGRVERRLAAILAVDVAGYSRLMGE